MVELASLWLRISWIVRVSSPSSCMWGAMECRRVWQLSGRKMPACLTAARRCLRARAAATAGDETAGPGVDGLRWGEEFRVRPSAAGEPGGSRPRRDHTALVECVKGGRPSRPGGYHMHAAPAVAFWQKVRLEKKTAVTGGGG